MSFYFSSYRRRDQKSHSSNHLSDGRWIVYLRRIRRLARLPACARARAPQPIAPSVSWRRIYRYSPRTPSPLDRVGHPERTATCLVRSRLPTAPLSEIAPPSASIDTNETASSSPPRLDYPDNARRNNSHEFSAVHPPVFSEPFEECSLIDSSSLSPPLAAVRSIISARSPVSPFSPRVVSAPPSAPPSSHLDTHRQPCTPTQRAKDRITYQKPPRSL